MGSCEGTLEQEEQQVQQRVPPQKQPYDHLLKVLLVGDHGVGKEEIMFRFAEDLLPTHPKIGVEFTIKTFELDGQIIKLQIWDTVGQCGVHPRTRRYYRGAMGILLVYDVTKERSFDGIRRWMDLIEEFGDEDVDVVLVGHRCEEENRVVDEQQGRELAKEYGRPFFEVSSMENINVKECFEMLSRKIIERKDLVIGKTIKRANSTRN
uniref:Uncharacterized protein n=1 Tax=Paramoeba aestuarina TaxID=180227 RepID=A0A7S4KGC6_9EUKA|mmetsp:Transcript_1827/g.2767  ORF Transcript_1827/g.2767 Transcript_1827/m.2767 type:complete len:208 (+) Transcript_1827:69-692(+)